MKCEKSDYQAPNRELYEADNFGLNKKNSIKEPCFSCQGRPFSKFMNKHLPAASPISTLHDTGMNMIKDAFGKDVGKWFNLPTMVPAAVVAIPAILDQYGTSFIPFYFKKKYEEK